MANERNTPTGPGERRDEVDPENIRGVVENDDDFEESEDDEDLDDEDDEEGTSF